MPNEPLVRDISDTARWVAAYRAQETARPDAVFRDPFARMLAGERGERIAATQTFSGENVWAFTARTWLFDQCIVDEVRAGAGVVVNLAAGLYGAWEPSPADVTPGMARSLSARLRKKLCRFATSR